MCRAEVKVGDLVEMRDGDLALVVEVNHDDVVPNLRYLLSGQSSPECLVWYGEGYISGCKIVHKSR